MDILNKSILLFFGIFKDTMHKEFIKYRHWCDTITFLCSLFLSCRQSPEIEIVPTILHYGKVQCYFINKHKTS